MKIKIQKAQIEDIPQIQEVYYKSWLDVYPDEKVGITIEDIEEAWRERHAEDKYEKRKALISDSSGRSIFLVAKDGDAVVGVFILMKHDRCNELGSIYILPEYQRQGIGKMFWQWADGFFEDGKEVFVRVADYNMKAISFYEKLGFADTGTRYTRDKFTMPVSGVKIPEMEMKMVFRKKA